MLPLSPRAAVYPEIAVFNTLVNDPSNYVFNDSLPLDARGPDGLAIACDPNAIAAEFGVGSNQRLNCVVNPALYQVPGLQRDQADTDAGLITIIVPAVNNGNIEVQGIDLNLAYNFSNDWGDFRFSVDYTHTDEYLVRDIPGLDLGLQESGRFDAAVTDGDSPIVREVPDNRGNITMGWRRNNHAVTVFNRHTGSFDVLSHNEFVNNPNQNPTDVSFAKNKVDSYNTWDIQYNYRHEWANSNWGTSNFTAGIIDLTDADIPLFRRDSFNPTVFDARGRRWYARMLWQW